MPVKPTYSVHALRYSARPTSRSHEFYRFEAYGCEAGRLDMDYFFWLIRDDQWTVLLDCGFHPERGAARDRRIDTHPTELLGRLGVSPQDVDAVVISHMHFDHVGNIELFPRARFYLARAELDFWAGEYGGRELMAKFVDPEEVAIVKRLLGEGRVELVEDAATVMPGIEAVRLGGHTPGELILDIATDGGSVVLAADALHYYEEMELDRPYAIYHELGEMYAGYDRLRALAARTGTTVVAGHDPLVRGMFREVEPECFDLTDRLAR